MESIKFMLGFLIGIAIIMIVCYYSEYRSLKSLKKESDRLRTIVDKIIDDFEKK